MKIGTILRIDSDAHGRYAMVARANTARVDAHSESGFLLQYDPTDASEFPVAGRLVVGTQYSGLEHKFRRCTVERENAIDQRLDVRVDDADGNIETSIPAIRLHAFYQWCEVQP